MTLPAFSRMRALLLILCLSALVLIWVQTHGESMAAEEPASYPLPNYDIRLDKKGSFAMAALRSGQSRSAVEIADIRDEFVRGEATLRSRVPQLAVEYGEELIAPQVIGTDARLGKSTLTGPSARSRPEILKGFLTENLALIGARSSSQIADLEVIADYTNPDGGLSFLELKQKIGGVAVFRGEIKAGFSRRNELIRVVSEVAPGVDYGSVPADFGRPLDAVRIGYASIGSNEPETVPEPDQARSSEQRIVFGTGDFAPVAEKIYFPLEPGVVIPAWRLLIWGATNSFNLIVDANSGTLLWRKNMTAEQTQPASYNVYANPSSMINLARSPFPMAPGQPSPNGQQSAGIPRTLVTRVGNEAPYSFNNLGWISDGGNTTDGNNVQAGLDRESPNKTSPSPDPGDIDPNGVAVATSGRVFDYPANPGIPTNPALGQGDDPIPPGQIAGACQAVGTATAPTNFQKASVTQLFYTTNVFHDEMYRLGFTEAAHNFQHDNFGRGGIEGDRISAQAQDCSGTNNANFSTPPDGFRGTMQMYLFSAPTPDIDGDLDADVVVHELTHGVSERLHANGDGLINDFARGMGEGWSDFYAACMLSTPAEPVDGVYPSGTYATYRFSTVGFNNYYYGIRRFPLAVLSARGGPSDRPHDPLTFADIDSTKMNLSDGAFSPRFTGNADEVHNIGEVWASVLWEVRARYVARLGWAIGNRRLLQFVTDGMKLAPPSPTFLSERDALVAAALASGTASDVADIWAGFAIRGVGANASIENKGGLSIGGSNKIRVTEAFDLPNLSQSPEITVSDASGDNDGFPEPGEKVKIGVPLSNSTGRTATGITAQIPGGGTADYGNLLSGLATTRVIDYTIPLNAGCGSTITLTINVNSSLGPVTFSRQVLIGRPVKTSGVEAFDAAPLPALPAGWTVQSIDGGQPFVTSANFADTAPNSVFAPDPATVGGGTDLTSPPIFVTASDASVSFRHRWATENGWDGGVLEISVAGAAYQDILTAGGTFVQNGYNSTLGVGDNNPLSGRAAWTGNSNGFVTTIVQMPAVANGKVVRLRWRFGADDNTAVTGWNVDTISFTNAGFVTEFACSLISTLRSRADFDGDGRTDTSIFRPGDGNWWVDRSGTGITAQTWGFGTDVPVPGDFDGDGITDLAVFRGDAGAAANFYVLSSSTGTVSAVRWGASGDIPVVADYDGDGKTDISVWRPSVAVWYTQRSSGGYAITAFGAAGDLPLAIDPDGDGRSNLATFRPSQGKWYITPRGGDPYVVTWGLPGDKPVPADYDGDNKDDIAVFRPSNGVWYILLSTTGLVRYVNFGQNGDIPVPGDYDGDGKDDVAVFRGGLWYINGSTAGISVAAFGNASDIPIPSKYIP